MHSDKQELSLEGWLATIASEEASTSNEDEHALLQEFTEWEALSKLAPNGKWRGANSRKWGKVGIELRLTGNVPSTMGPFTQLGALVCRFIDIVEDSAGAGRHASSDFNEDISQVSSPKAALTTAHRCAHGLACARLCAQFCCHNVSSAIHSRP